MIGIMSDTHDDLEGIRKAVNFFNSMNVGLVLHAGDVISPFTVKEFKALECRLEGVFGNNDGERWGLNEKFSEIGTELRDLIELEHDGVRICLYHGTYEAIVKALAESSIYDVVVRGHTHRAEITKRDETILINPGEVCGYLTGKKTVAVLDTGDMKADICDIHHNP
jgi:putative phosphoesterase